MKIDYFEILHTIEEPIFVLKEGEGAIFFQNKAAIALQINDIEKLNTTHFQLKKQTFEIRKKTNDGFTVVHLNDISRENELESAFGEFIRLASHELREPARKISNFGQKLTAEVGQKIEARPKIYVERMLAAAERLQQMLSDLTRLSRVKSSTEVTAIDLVDTIKKIAQEKDIKLELKTNLSENYRGESVLMIELLNVLLDNVAKFKKSEPAQANIELYLKSVNLEISIEDKGIGMTKEEFEEAKKPFVRLNGRSEYKGSGIGLAIAAKIIQVLKGQLSFIESEVGTKIKVSIPTN